MEAVPKRKRKRYNVTIECNGEKHQLVIVDYDVKGMLRVVRKHYGLLLFDDKGKDTGTISYEETNLG